MIIQCPECLSRYRTRVLTGQHSPLQVKCPKCQHRFSVDPKEMQVSSGGGKKSTILLVDDARFFRELMLDLLKERNAQLLTAETAAETWSMLQQQNVDLLIVDINLPDKNGLDLIREIRLDDAFKTLRILSISGVYRKSDDAIAAIRAGADDFISKSFKPHELNERIDKLLAE